MTSFHRLTIADVRPETSDSASLGFLVPAPLRPAFAFTPGQYLTLRARVAGEDLRRTYSICSPPDDDELRVAIKRVAGGRFSNWALDTLRAGATIDVMPPQGSFGPPSAGSAGARYLGFAAGSGITPILSIVAHVLAREPRSRMTLVYGNRRAETAMFRATLEALGDRHADRFTLIHVLSDDARAAGALPGRVDRARLDALIAGTIDPRGVDHVLICGPGDMAATLREGLLAHGVAPAAIRVELFTAPPSNGRPDPVGTEATGYSGTATVTVIRDGARRSFAMPPSSGNLVDAAEAAGLELPYSCKGGVCATCRCKLMEGRVAMAENFALGEEEVEAGYILACQSRPTTAAITIDYDAP